MGRHIDSSSIFTTTMTTAGCEQPTNDSKILSSINRPAKIIVDISESTGKNQNPHKMTRYSKWAIDCEFANDSKTYTK